MGNVFDAMKKHEEEQVQQAAQRRLALEKDRAAAPAGGGGGASETATAAAVAEAPQSIDGYSRALAVHHDRGGRLAEQYRMLRTNLLAQCPSQRFCMITTSAEATEGKSVTCLNLALALAESQDRRVLVIDGDLRRPGVARLLRVEEAPGLAEVLRGEVRPAEALRQTLYANVSVLCAGRAGPEEFGLLLGKPELEEMIADWRRRHDFVLIDTPPVQTASDAIILGRLAGEALLVVRMHKTRCDSVDRAIRLLRAANVKIGGLVLTHEKYMAPGYLYPYAYRYRA